jgi:hypothetical protein
VEKLIDNDDNGDVIDDQTLVTAATES